MFLKDLKIIFIFAFYHLKLVLMLFYKREQMYNNYNMNLQIIFLLISSMDSQYWV